MTNIIQDLGDGLVLRRSTKADADAIAEFNRAIHGESEWEEKGLVAWTQDLMSGDHPNHHTDDFTIVEDVQQHRIVSAMNLISQTWAYEGTPFGVGRPELVGTLPEYRERGLVRKQFEIVHQWSAERGELVQAITGIPYYYRQFGYEMALNLSGGRAGYVSGVMKLKPDQTETYLMRKATLADIPFIQQCYHLGCERDEISTVWNEQLWGYELTGKHEYNINLRQIYIIEDGMHLPVGYFAVPSIKWGNTTAITAYELIPGADWFKVTAAVVRWLWQFGVQQAEAQGQLQQAFGFWLGESHPVYQVYENQLPRVREPYAWFIRVPDLAKFISTITPALDQRLSQSIMNCYSGELKLDFYRKGLKLVFEQGHLSAVEDLVGKGLKECHASFPDLTFLQILFGRQDLSELQSMFADISVKSDENKLLLNTLFPRKSSNLWPIS